MNTSKRRSTARKARQVARRQFIAASPELLVGDIVVDPKASQNQYFLETWILFGGRLQDRYREARAFVRKESPRAMRAYRNSVKRKEKSDEFLKKLHADRAKHKEKMSDKAARIASKIASKFTAYRRQQG